MPTVYGVASYLSRALFVAWDQTIGAIIQPFGDYCSEGMKATPVNDSFGDIYCDAVYDLPHLRTDAASAT